MRSVALLLLFFLGACSDQQSTTAVEPEKQIGKVDYVLPAFGGKLLGTDRGEWIGKLMFEDEAGRVRTLLNENVRGIIRNDAGVFVFTGLSHLSTNEGDIYVVEMMQDDKVHVRRLGRLPGAPSQVRKHADGSTGFLVFAGFRQDRHYYECYSLTGEIVARSTNCTRPRTAAH